MPKPTLTEAEWNTAGANELVPSASHKTAGWGLAGGGRLANSQMMNYWKRRVYLWLSWLNSLWDGSGNLTLENNASVTVQGTGKYKRPEREYKLHACNGSIKGAGSVLSNGAGLALEAAGSELQLAIPLQSGEKLTKVIIKGTGDAGGGMTAGVQVTKRHQTSGVYQMTPVGVVPAANANFTITLSTYDAGYPFGAGALAETAVANDGFTYIVVVTGSGAMVGTGIKVADIYYYTTVD